MGRVLFSHAHLLRFDRKQFAIGKPYPPLATITAAAHLRARGHEVALFDPMLDDDVGGFGAALANFRPTLVAIYDDVFNWFTKMCLGRMREAALRMTAEARAAGARVVIAGHDAADAPEVYLAAGADFVIRGEGELTLAELAARLDDPDPTGGGVSADDIPGLVFRQRGLPRRTAPRGLLKNLDELPLPAWDLVDVNRYRDFLAAAARVLVAERRDHAGLPVPVQLVREAGLRQHVPHALARACAGRASPAARTLRA